MEFKIPVPWGHIACRSYGSWSGLPVLAIHDWGENSGSFELLAPLISKELYFLVIDLPGHGQSSHLPPGTAYHRIDIPTVLKRIVDHQKWKKFSLFGHSAGAELAVLFTAAFPNYVDRIILIDRIKPSSISFANRATELANIIDEQVDNDTLYEEYEKNPPKFVYNDQIRRRWENSRDKYLTSEELLKPILDREIARVDGEAEFVYIKDVIRLLCPDSLIANHEQALNLAEGLKGFPVLIIRTKDADLFTSDEEQRKIEKDTTELYKRICRKLKEVEIEGGHFILLSRPQEIITLIHDFLLSG